MLAVLHRIYRRAFAGRGGLGTRPAIERLHRYAWTPLVWLLRLNLRVFISVKDLRLIARRPPDHGGDGAG